MNITTREQQRLLIVDDSKVVRVTARKILRDHFETVEAIDGENAWNILAGDEIFSLVISDLNMPKLDGFELLERIRNSPNPHIRDLPVIIITGANDSQATKERATLAGATDFIGKPFDSVHLLARTQAHASAHSSARTLREASLALESEITIDPLTRLANQTAFMELGYQQLAYAVRHNTRLSVFYIEIDHYGDLYRTHGDSVCESIIQTVATLLTATARHEDTVARIGTARFALLLPELNNNGIQNLANRIRKCVSDRVLKHGEVRTHFTISIGVAAMEIRRNTRFDDLVSLAGSRLAEALARGGDRIVDEDDDYPPQRQQSGLELAAAIQAESVDVIEIQIDDVPVHAERIYTGLPATDSRMAPAPVLLPVEGTTTGDALKVHVGEHQKINATKQTLAIRSARIGLLERLLTGLFSVCKRDRKPQQGS
ncbi:MAG: diguanylate cyclase [Gammaproteobacteria bacterium]